MARFKINALNVADMGVGILMNINIPIAYKKQVQAILDKFKPGIEYEIEPFKAKRSLKANAYFWKLADELAKVLRTTKEHVYKVVIYNVGKHDVLETHDKVVNGNVVKTASEIADDFCKGWCANGLGWFAYKEKFKPNIIHVYYGSSVYNTEEMARIIDYLQDECRRQGIETRPKEEVEAMLKEWGKEHG